VEQAVAELNAHLSPPWLSSASAVSSSDGFAITVGSLSIRVPLPLDPALHPLNECLLVLLAAHLLGCPQGLTLLQCVGMGLALSVAAVVSTRSLPQTKSEGLGEKAMM